MYKYTNSIINCNVLDFEYGLLLTYSDNNTLTGIESYSNNYGFHIHSSNLTDFADINASDNVKFGLYFYSSEKNILDTVEANYNQRHGLYLDLSHNNSLTSITANYNTENGLHFWGSKYNTIANSNSSYNSKGIYLLRDSDYNVINDSRMEGNTNYSVYLAFNNSYFPQYNLIYNCYFSSSNNFGSDVENDMNTLNGLNEWSGTMETDCVNTGSAYGHSQGDTIGRDRFSSDNNERLDWMIWGPISEVTVDGGEDAQMTTQGLSWETHK